MGGTRLHAEFPAEDSFIDRNGITVGLRDASNGWLLSSPLTTTFSKMQLSRPRQSSQSPCYHRSMSRSGLDKLTAACRISSRELQARLSISSDSSDSGMMEDAYESFGLSDSDISFEDNDLYNGSIYGIPTEEELWRSYWTPEKYHDESKTQSPPWGEACNLSSCNRTFASFNLPGLDISEHPSNLRRSDAVRTPQRSKLAHSLCTPKAAVDALPRTTYSAFPTTPLTNSDQSSPPTYLHPTEPTHTQHKSWPVRVESEMNQAPLRSRAQTTPSQFKVKHPSNLSTCTALDKESSSTISSSNTHLYMRSAPVSPQFAPPLMDMMKSAWDYDDDDEDDQGKSQRFIEWVEKLHIRSRSTNTRSLSKALKGVFGKKKGATL